MLGHLAVFSSVPFNIGRLHLFIKASGKKIGGIAIIYPLEELYYETELLFASI